MRIAVFYPTTCTAWSITKGLCPTLTRMGHDVTDCGETFNSPLENYKIIFVSGPEYLWKRLRETYPNWDSLTATKVGWLHETVEREDYSTNRIAVSGKLPVEELKRFTPNLFTPATQDTLYGLTFLPFGVDTTKFYPQEKGGHGSIYTGSMYGKRRALLEAHPEIRALAAYRNYETGDQYAEAIAKASVVLNLPSLSEASNTRTFEVLASKTALITPAMLHLDGLFEHGKHLLYYQGSPASAFASLTPELAESISHQGYLEVTKKHTIERRLEDVLNRFGSKSLRTITRKAR